MTEKDRLLGKIEEKYGISISVLSDMDEAEVIRALRAMAGEAENMPYGGERASDEELLAYLDGGQTEEDAARTRELLEAEYSGMQLALYRIVLYAPADDDVRRIILGLANEGARLIKSGTKELLLLTADAEETSYSGFTPVETERGMSRGKGEDRQTAVIKAAAAEIADTLAAEAMITAKVAVDTITNNAGELPLIAGNTRSAMVIGTRLNPGAAVYPYHDMAVGNMLGRMSTEEKEEFLNDTLGTFRFANLDTEMRTTIRTFFDVDLSVTETARRLFIHRNTLVYRIDKLYKLSGLDLRRFTDAVTARLALAVEELAG